MLCVAATVMEGYDALAVNWGVACDAAKRRGAAMDPNTLRLVGPMHIAASREKARDDVRYGLEKWVDYFTKVNPLTPPDFRGQGDMADRLVESGRAVIGTPEDAIRQIERLEAKQGPFGAFLLLAHNWASFEATKQSYELFVRHVLPHFNRSNEGRAASLAWAEANGGEFMGAAAAAVMETIQKHAAEGAKKE
jgi:limonene 1,2-monooxygenase